MFSWQFFVTFLGWLSDPFKGLSDLQLGDEKVTLNHLVHDLFQELSLFLTLMLYTSSPSSGHAVGWKCSAKISRVLDKTGVTL